MGIAHLRSRACLGIDTIEVSVEVHASKGTPGLHIVGLGDTALKEAKERVRSALINCHFGLTTHRIIVNLAPADLPKDGSQFDLAIALGVLIATKQIQCGDVSGYEFVGELALSGKLRRVKQVLPLAKGTQEAGRSLMLPTGNASEAAFIDSLTLLPSDHLLAIVAHLCGQNDIAPYRARHGRDKGMQYLDLSDVHGQMAAKRALEVAAAGGHHLMMMGPPGTGKTMLALRLPGILPNLTDAESLSSGLVYSLARRRVDWGHRPFRSPHHTLSNVALVGGGNPPMPGEISLAHNGVLFLDEFPEFKRSSLEALREPLESESIHIARAHHTVVYPASFQLVSAMNPCPCGYLTHPVKECVCSANDVYRYTKKISGPLMDRIDLQIIVDSAEYQPGAPSDGERSVPVRERVIEARRIQYERQGELNFQLKDNRLARALNLTDDAKKLLSGVMNKATLSNRGITKILKVARTVADLAHSPSVTREHLLEALCYRLSDTI